MKNDFFIEAFFKNPFKTGAIIPSSRFLAAQMTKPIDFQRAKCIVEFGAGTGVLTKAILAQMPKDGVLFSFEINNDFVRQIKKEISDKRLKMINDKAENFEKYLKKERINEVDCFVSGLPLASLPKKEIKNILFLVKKYLNSNGLFIQFQYFLTDWMNFKKIFYSVSVNFEPRNIPPAFIYVCKDV